MKTGFTIISVFSLAFLCGGCKKEAGHAERQEPFTKADSLTERFLELQDSTLACWNTLVSDETYKIRTMHSLLHELLVSSQFDKEELITLEKRLDQISGTNLTLESIQNTSLIEEYDFASNALLTELVTLAESDENFAHNKTLQKLVDGITLADQRVEENRINYDRVASMYNQFVDRNQSVIMESEENIHLEKKPLFQATATE